LKGRVLPAATCFQSSNPVWSTSTALTSLLRRLPASLLQSFANVKLKDAPYRVKLTDLRSERSWAVTSAVLSPRSHGYLHDRTHQKPIRGERHLFHRASPKGLAKGPSSQSRVVWSQFVCKVSHHFFVLSGGMWCSYGSESDDLADSGHVFELLPG